MAVISINVGQVQHLRRVIQQRQGDVHHTHQRLVQVRQRLSVDPRDPATQGLAQRIDIMQRHLAQLGADLDQHHRSTTRFIEGVLGIDGRARRPRLWLPLPGRPRRPRFAIPPPQWWLPRPLPPWPYRRPRPIPYPQLIYILRPVPLPWPGNWRRPLPMLRPPSPSPWDRYVGDRFQQLVIWVGRNWRPITTGFLITWAITFRRYGALVLLLRQARPPTTRPDPRTPPTPPRAPGPGSSQPKPKKPVTPTAPSERVPAHLFDDASDWLQRVGSTQYGFDRHPGGNCTDFVAWRLNDIARKMGLTADQWNFSNSTFVRDGQRLVPPNQWNDSKSHNGPRFGSAHKWINAVDHLGIPRTQDPTVGAVAALQGDSSPPGHVAIVAAVHRGPDGSVVSIEIEESYYGSKVYERKTLRPGDNGWPDDFYKFF